MTANWLLLLLKSSSMASHQLVPKFDLLLIPLKTLNGTIFPIDRTCFNPFLFFSPKKVSRGRLKSNFRFQTGRYGGGTTFPVDQSNSKCFSSRQRILFVRPDLHVKNIPQMQSKHIGVNAPTSRLHLRWIVLKNVIYLYSAKHPHLPPL